MGKWTGLLCKYCKKKKAFGSVPYCHDCKKIHYPGYMASLRKYQNSAKGKIVKRRYDKSEKGRARVRHFQKSEKRKLLQRKYDKSEKGKARDRRYHYSAKGKISRDKYRSKPPVKEHYKWKRISNKRHKKIEQSKI